MICRGRISSGPNKGQPCKRPATAGALVCRSHGAAAPQVAAKAAVVAEVARWGLDGNSTTVDAGETLLRLLSQSRWRAEHYAAEIERMVAVAGSVEEALTGTQKVLNPTTGNLVDVGEFIRAMATLEAQERDRCGHFASLAIKAGLAERQVRIAERQGMLIELVLSRVFDEIGLSPGQRAAAVPAIRKALESA